MSTFEGIIVDYMINAPCNLGCPFCYGPDPKLSRQELNLSQKLSLLENLSQLGVEKIVIAGGEPTMDPDIIEVCKKCKECEIGLSLQTNGYFPLVINKLLPFLDWIALPLDGVSEKSQMKMRTSKTHLSNFLNSVNLVTKYNTDNQGDTVKVKVGTVASKFNIAELEDMADIIATLGINVWKINKLRPRGNGSKVGVIDVETGLIEEQVVRIERKHKDLNFFYSSGEDNKDAYIIIDPDSDTYVVKGKGQQKSFGKLFNANNEFLVSKFLMVREYVNFEDVVNNINRSFPGWI